MLSRIIRITRDMQLNRDTSHRTMEKIRSLPKVHSSLDQIAASANKFLVQDLLILPINSPSTDLFSQLTLFTTIIRTKRLAISSKFLDRTIT